MRNLTTVLMMSAALILGSGLAACSSGGGSRSDGGGDGTADGTGGTDGTGTDGTGTDGTGTDGTGTDGTGVDDTSVTDECNVNGTCEPDLGETSANCADCCEAFCQPGWECGPDGCGGICGGGCDAGFTCNNAKHVCEEEIIPDPLQPYGAVCGRKDECQPSIDTPDGPQDNPQWPACVNAQCESGTCVEPTCSKSCTITKDQTDWALNPGPDGIDDPDAAFNDCAGAEDGPLGTNYTCVALLPPDQGQPLNLCLAGTTFKECTTSGDCPQGETCQLQYIVGEYSARCSGAPKGGVGIGEYCNRNPEDGDVLYCETTLCFGLGCTGFCDTNAECNTDTCDAGKCASSGTDCAIDDDCSYFECRKDYTLFGSDQPDITFDICFSKECENNDGCIGNSHCAISGNGEQGEAVDWEHLCVVSPPDAAALGEECEDDTSDNIPKPECAGPCLNNGVCSAICGSDADCAAVPTMKCNANAVPVDFEDDGIDDKWLALGLCVDYPGSGSACAKDADCGADEVCDFYPFFTDDTQSTIDGKGICSTFEAGQGDVGDACGGNSGVTCKSGFCLGSQGDQPGYCTVLCDTKDDCPQGATLGLFQGTYNLVCRSLVYSDGFVKGTNEDMLWIPLCVPTVADTSSLNDCAADPTSCPANQACQPFAIAQGATGPGKVEFKCVGAGVFDDQGQFLPATGDLGDSCDITFESTSPSDSCKSNQCLQDDEVDKGYCGALCTTDADCSTAGESLVCDDLILIDRADDANDVTVKMCRKDAACIVCSTDADCTGDKVCINAGGIGVLADRRCADPCSSDSDCSSVTCQESIDSNGSPEGTFACVPDSCD